MIYVYFDTLLVTILLFNTSVNPAIAVNLFTQLEYFCNQIIQWMVLRGNVLSKEKCFTLKYRCSRFCLHSNIHRYSGKARL